MNPIILPPLLNPAWRRAATIADTLLIRGKANPLIVAALTDGYAESAWTAVIPGDHGQSFGPWQMKWEYYGSPARAALGVDIRTEPDLVKHVDVLLWALALPANRATLAALDLATNGADATRLFASSFERASAGGAVERRVALAPKIEVWMSGRAA